MLKILGWTLKGDPASVETAVSFQKGIYLFPEFLPHALAAFSSRAFEASKDLSLFLESVGARPDRFCTVEQVHGDRVVLVSGSGGGEGRKVEADGLVTQERNLALVIRTADCVPLFLFDPQIPAVGICHVGWRGARRGIVSGAIEMFQGHFASNPSSLRVGMGPAIRESCYEVGQEFEDYFPGFVRREGEGYFFDLVGFARKQLVEAGVREESVQDSNLCTACLVDRFFSARREGNETGRFLSAIMLK